MSVQNIFFRLVLAVIAMDKQPIHGCFSSHKNFFGSQSSAHVMNYGVFRICGHLRFVRRPSFQALYWSSSRLQIISARGIASASKPLAKRSNASSIKTQTDNSQNRSTQARQCSRLSALFKALQSCIKSSENPDVVTARVEKKLNYYMPKLFHPHSVYESVIRFLMDRSCLPAILMVYNRMTKEGFIVSPQLEADMVVVALAIADEKTRPEGLATLKSLVTNPSLSSDDLLRILNRMVELQLPSDMLEAVMSEFYNSHQASDGFDLNSEFFTRMVKVQTDSGKIDEALDTLFDIPDENLVNEKDASQHPYTSFISAIRNSRHWDVESIDNVLNIMAEKKLEPTTSLFNVLISYEARTNSLYNAFTIYQALKKQRKVIPDAFTFGTLFNVLNRINNLHLSERPRHPPGNIPSPRELFRDMMNAFVQHGGAPEFTLTTSLLNVILRTFLYTTDYEGAFVTLVIFSRLHVPVNVKTYLLVYRRIMRRIKFEVRSIRSTNSDRWADRFLGLPYPIRHIRQLTTLQLGEPLVAHILNVTSRRNFKLAWPLYIIPGPYETEPRHFKVPTVENTTGADPVPLDMPFDRVPLERVLRKAILAKSDDMRTHGFGTWARLYVVRSINKAKNAMLSEGLITKLGMMRKTQERGSKIT